MRIRCSALALVFALPAVPAEKLTMEDRIEILRGINAEFATVKKLLPRSKKPLPFNADGTWDVKKWDEIAKEQGPAARQGDLIQVTKVTIEDDKILLEINGGLKSGRSWRDRIELGGGMGGAGRSVPISNPGSPTTGTYIAIEFHKPVPALKSAEIKKILAPIFDFERRTVTEVFSQTLPPEIQQAIKDKKARDGMDKEMVVLALGKPVNKSREVKDGVEYEDWVYGQAPGKITFVTFQGDKVVKVKETYAGLGAEASQPLDPK